MPPLSWPALLFRARPVPQPDGVLPVLARVGTKFAQNHVLALASRRPLALLNRPQILPFRLSTQRPPFVPLVRFRVGLHLKWRDVAPFGYILRGAIRRIAHFGTNLL